MKKKIIAFAALMIMMIAACLLVGCNDEPVTTEPPAGNDTPSLVLDSSNIANYKIIRPDETESGDSEIYTRLSTGINAALGVRPKVESDFLYPGDVPGEFEIVFGETNREESTEVYKDLKYSDYMITVKGSKIIIAGGCVESRKAAVEKFLSFFKDGAGNISHYEYKAEYAKSDITIDGVSISKYKIVYSSQNNLAVANIIKNEIGKACGYRLPIVKHNTEKTEYEIAVGDTNRNPMIALDYYTYKVAVSGSSIHLNGYDIYALNAGARKIVDMLTTPSGDIAVSSLAYDYKVPTNAEMAEDIDSLYLYWTEDWQPPEGMLDYEAKKDAIVNVSDRLMTCAHRADSTFYPENSLPAIISFYKMGGDVVELDVMATKDNVLILMHDTTLKRMTNADEYVGKTIDGITFPDTYNVTDWTYEQIQYLYLKEGWGDAQQKTWGGKEAELTSFKVPTLTEALKVCKNRMFILPDKAQSGNGGQWRYADIDGVQDANRDVFLYNSMVEADNYESIILSYGYLSASDAVTVQAWIYERTNIAPLIIVRKDNASGVMAEYTYLEKKAIPDTYAVHIGGAYSSDFEGKYSTAYAALKDKVLIHGWTILYTESGAVDTGVDNSTTWQTMYDLGYRMIMGNNYMKLVQYAANIYKDAN